MAKFWVTKCYGFKNFTSQINQTQGIWYKNLTAAFYSGKIGDEFIRSIVAALIWNLEKCISNEEISNQADL